MTVFCPNASGHSISFKFLRLTLYSLTICTNFIVHINIVVRENAFSNNVRNKTPEHRNCPKRKTDLKQQKYKLMGEVSALMDEQSESDLSLENEGLSCLTLDENPILIPSPTLCPFVSPEKGRKQSLFWDIFAKSTL